MSSYSAADALSKNMTEVLFPNQSFDTHQFASTDWYLSPSTAAPTGQQVQRHPGQAPVAAAAADSPTASAATQAPLVHKSSPRPDLAVQERHPFSAASFRGLGGPMSHPNPFEQQNQALANASLYSHLKQPPTSHPSSSAASAAARAFAQIAPDSSGLQRVQSSNTRQHSDPDDSYDQRAKKRRLTSSSSMDGQSQQQSSSQQAQQPPPLRDEDKLLLQLKDEQSLPWKDIAARFQTETGKVHMIPALQMRYKRLKERLQVWTDPDVEALKQAHEYWESKKFDIISSKMLEFGATEKFSPRACMKKWLEINPQPEYMPPLTVVPPGFSQPSTTSVSPQPRQMPGGGHHMYGSPYSSGLYAPPPDTPQSQYGGLPPGAHPSYGPAAGFHQHSPYGQTGPGAQQYASAAPHGQAHGMYRQPAPHPSSYAHSPVQQQQPSQGHAQQQQALPPPQSQGAQQSGPHRMSTYPPASHASGSYNW